MAGVDRDLEGALLDDRYLVGSLLRSTPWVTRWLASDQRAQRQVVVARPRAELVESPADARALTAALRRLAAFNLARLVQVYDIGSHEDIPHLLLQHVSGLSLAALVHRRGAPLSPEHASEWLFPVASALVQIHGAGLAHDEISPDAVLLDEQAHVLLDDFRTTVAARELPAGARQPVPAALLAFTAPERLRGAPASPESDQFALAKLLEWCILGRTLAPSEPALGAAIGVPIGAAAAIQRASSSDPAHRWPSCAAFADAWHGGLIEPSPLVVTSTRPAPLEPPTPSRAREPAALPVPTPAGAESRAVSEDQPHAELPEQAEGRQAARGIPEALSPSADWDDEADDELSLSSGSWRRRRGRLVGRGDADLEDDSIAMPVRPLSRSPRRGTDRDPPRRPRSAFVTVLITVATLAFLAAALAGALAWVERKMLVAWWQLEEEGMEASTLTWPPEVTREGGFTMTLVPVGDSVVAIDSGDVSDAAILEAVRKQWGDITEMQEDAREAFVAAYCALHEARAASREELASMGGPRGPRCARSPGDQLLPPERPVPEPLSLQATNPASGDSVPPGTLVLRGRAEAALAHLTADGMPCEVEGSEFACELRAWEDGVPVSLQGESDYGRMLGEALAFVADSDPLQFEGIAESFERAGLAPHGIATGRIDAVGAGQYRRHEDDRLVVAVEAPSGPILFDRDVVKKSQWSHFDTSRRRRSLPPPPTTPTTTGDEAAAVSAADATAYCEWAGGRLATEDEWQHAARGARSDLERPLLAASEAGILGFGGAEWIRDGRKSRAVRLEGPADDARAARVRCVMLRPTPERAVDVGPMLDQARAAWQRGAITRGEDSALALIRAVEAQEPGNPQARELRTEIVAAKWTEAQAAETARSWGKARAASDIVLAFVPRHPEATTLLARAKDELQREAESADFAKRVEDELKKALLKPLEDSSAADRHVALAAIEEQLSNLDDPSDRLIAVLRQASEARVDVVEWRMRPLEEAEARGDFMAVIASARKVLALDPQHERASKLLREAERKVKLRDEAASLADQASALERSADPRDRVRAAQLLREAKSKWPAEEEHGKRADAIFASFWSEGQGHLKGRRYSAAVAPLESALEISPDDVQVQADLRNAKAGAEPTKEKPAPAPGAHPQLTKFEASRFFKRARGDAWMVKVKGEKHAVGGRGLPRVGGLTIDLYMDLQEVSVDDYAQFALATGRSAPAPARNPDQPVVNVSFADAQAYCRWVGGRLPREHEWQMAAVGTHQGNQWPWGSEFKKTHVVAAEGDQSELTSNVLPEGVSEYGLLHMAGNAAEWVADWDLAPSPAGQHRVRGGSFKDLRADVETRARKLASGPAPDIGFRCVIDP